MDIYTELIRSHIATCNAMKTDLKHALAVQDWKPSAHCSDSQENQDTDTQDEAIGNHDMDSVGEVEPEPLGQPLFQDELNELFAELEHNLPPVPLQGPDQPQVPSPPRDPATGGGSAQPPALRKDNGTVAFVPVATPCRVSTLIHGCNAKEGNQAGLHI